MQSGQSDDDNSVEVATFELKLGVSSLMTRTIAHKPSDVSSQWSRRKLVAEFGGEIFRMTRDDRTSRGKTRRSSLIGYTAGLLMIDIYYFKNCYGAFGHAACDRCLIEIGRLLQAHTRRPDDLDGRNASELLARIIGGIGLSTT